MSFHSLSLSQKSSIIHHLQLIHRWVIFWKTKKAISKISIFVSILHFHINSTYPNHLNLDFSIPLFIQSSNTSILLSILVMLYLKTYSHHLSATYILHIPFLTDILHKIYHVWFIIVFKCYLFSFLCYILWMDVS